MAFFLAHALLAGAIVGGYYYFGIIHNPKRTSFSHVIDIPKPSESAVLTEPSKEPVPGTESTKPEPTSEGQTDENTTESDPEKVTQEPTTAEPTTAEPRKNIEYLAWTEKFIDKFTEEVVKTENSYSDQHVNVTITKGEDGEGERKVTYYVADIYVASVEYFRSALYYNDIGNIENKTAEQISQWNPSNLLVTNGDYAFYNQQGMVVRNGQILCDNFDYSDLLVMQYDGTMKIVPANTYTVDQAIADSAWQVWAFGPSLLREDGSAKTDTAEYSLTSTNQYGSLSYLAQDHPRTAIGYYEPGHYCMVVIDGRQPGYSRGLSFLEMSVLFENLGCKIGYNLDGGGSSQMIFDGSYVNQELGRAVPDFITVDIDPPERRK